LCVKILRGGEAIKALDVGMIGPLKKLREGTISVLECRRLLRMIRYLIDVLDGIIFSASALLYREEKALEGFMDNVEKTTDRLIKRLGRDKKKYGGCVRALRKMKNGVKSRKKYLRLGEKAEKAKKTVSLEEIRKKEVVSLLHRLTAVLENIDVRVNKIYKAGKAQRRETLNVYTARESITLRSNYRFGELTGRDAIEVSGLSKNIKALIGGLEKKLRKITDTKGKLNRQETEKLVKECRIEAKDLEEIIAFVIDIKKRVKKWLEEVRKKILGDSKFWSLRSELREAQRRFNVLTEDIETQHRRLRNE